MGEGLFNHETPDGYAMTSAAWNGPGQMMARFEIARAIGSGSAGLFKPDVPNASDQPAFPLIQNALYFNGLKQTLGPSTLAALDNSRRGLDSPTRISGDGDVTAGQGCLLV